MAAYSAEARQSIVQQQQMQAGRQYAGLQEQEQASAAVALQRQMSFSLRVSRTVCLCFATVVLQLCAAEARCQRHGVASMLQGRVARKVSRKHHSCTCRVSVMYEYIGCSATLWVQVRGC
jgi:hypothetical protein